MKSIKKYNEITFESIRHINDYGVGYWTARELMVALEYSKWSNFVGVIEKAKIACDLSNNNIKDHFADVGKTIKMPKGATKEINDYQLSRYACYLIVQNADPKKEKVALGQTYFAVQTRKQEIREKEYNLLTEDEKKILSKKIN